MGLVWRKNKRFCGELENEKSFKLRIHNLQRKIKGRSRSSTKRKNESKEESGIPSEDSAEELTDVSSDQLLEDSSGSSENIVPSFVTYV